MPDEIHGDIRPTCLVQARMGSSRLPGKVLAEVGGISVISLILARLSMCQMLQSVVVVTSDNVRDDVLVDSLSDSGVNIFRGSETDVMSRYVEAIEYFQCESVVRVTADCPFIQPSIVDACVHEFLCSGLDYVSNIEPPTFPDGLDVEVFKASSLVDRFKCLQSSCFPAEEREHVTWGLRKCGEYRRGNIESHYGDLSCLRVTLDTVYDLKVIRSIACWAGDPKHVGLEDIIKFFKEVNAEQGMMNAP